MGELRLIEDALRRANRRRRLLCAWSGFWKGLLAGALIWLVVYGIFKIYPLPKVALISAAAVAGACVLAGLLFGLFKSFSLIDAARWVDNRQRLQERLSTALELSRNGGSEEWKELVLRDAAGHAKDLDLPKLLPFSWPRLTKWALLIAVLGVCLGFVPEYRSKAFVRKQKDSANIRDTGKHLADFTRRTIEERKPVLEPTQKALADVAELGDKLNQASLTRADALKDLASVAEKLSQQAQEFGKNPAFKPLEQAARESGGSGNQTPEGLQQQMNALQKALGNTPANGEKLDKMRRDLQKAQQALANMPDKDSAEAKAAREAISQSLAELSKQMHDMGQSLEGLDEAIRALQNQQTDLAMREMENALTDLDKLREMAKTLEKLQQQAAKLGKDLAEQLKNGQAQAAQKTLEKMVEELKNANLTPEQMQKLMDEVSRSVQPGSQYGKVGELLKNASEQMKAGEKSGAAQNLAAAAKELEKLMQQMADAQALMAALDGLDRAQLAIMMGKDWEQCKAGMCKACGGMGCKECMGKELRWGHGGKPGRGVGTWAEEEGWTYFDQEQQRWDNSGVERPDMEGRGQTDRPANMNPNLMPTKVRGQMSPGGPMPSITLKGVSIKGQSTIQYQEAAAAAQAAAESALNQDQVPRAYQNTVRDYFDDLKK
jgi:tetratricopeptide (TPR) repeat protein